MRKDKWTRSMEKMNKREEKEEAAQLDGLSKGKRHTGRRILLFSGTMASRIIYLPVLADSFQWTWRRLSPGR